MPEGRAAVPALERTELQGLHSWIARPRRKWRYRIRRAGGRDCGWLRRRTGHLRPARTARLRTLRYPDPATLLTCSGGVYTRTKLHRGVYTRTKLHRGVYTRTKLHRGVYTRTKLHRGDTVLLFPL